MGTGIIFLYLQMKLREVKRLRGHTAGRGSWFSGLQMSSSDSSPLPSIPLGRLWNPRNLPVFCEAWELRAGVHLTNSCSCLPVPLPGLAVGPWRPLALVAGCSPAPHPTGLQPGSWLLCLNLQVCRRRLTGCRKGDMR